MREWKLIGDDELRHRNLSHVRVLGNASIVRFVLVTQNQVMNSQSGASVEPMRTPWSQFQSLRFLGCKLLLEISRAWRGTTDQKERAGRDDEGDGLFHSITF